MLSYEESLKILRETNALLEGHFILSSGLHSPKYIQCAQLMSKPELASKICSSLSEKIQDEFAEFDLILSPAMGGILVGFEIGRLLKKETIFAERVNGEFKLRRDFTIKKNQKVLIVEDVITTGKSSLECVTLIKKSNAILLGFACLIDRSEKKTLKIKKKKIISQIKLKIPSYKEKNIPETLKKIPITKPGSRFIK